MAELLKSKVNDVNSELFTNFFEIQDLNNYEFLFLLDIQSIKLISDYLKDKKKVTIIGNDKEIKKIFKGFDDVVITTSSDASFVSIKHIESSDVILIDREDVDEIIGSIERFKGIIIVNKNYIQKLYDLQFLKENYEIKDNECLKIDKYGIESRIKA